MEQIEKKYIYKEKALNKLRRKMIVRLEKQRFLRIFFLLIIIMGLLQCSFSWVIFYIAQAQVKATQERFASIRIIYDLAESSDNLTKMAQIYAITGNKKYRDYYNNILAIRNGLAPRPLNYDLFYWNLIPESGPIKSNTPAVSLLSLMEQQHFSDEEFELLNLALNQSNDLSLIETTAMNAVEGKFDDGSYTFSLKGPPNPELAKKLLFDETYWKQKKDIFAPMEIFALHVIERTELQLDNLNGNMLLFMTISRILSAIAAVIMIFAVIKAIRSLSEANKSNELLLLNIFPSAIVDRLKKGEETIADEYQASILFADIVHFTESSAQLGPTKIVKMLNGLFGEFDLLTDKYGIEKVKTMGDNYMAAAGVPIPMSDHANCLANFALDLKQALITFNEKNGFSLQMRIGMNCGTVIAGVIGHKKFIYDVWGDVVNTASRMESSGEKNEIQITQKMALILEDRFVIEKRAPMEVKGKGLMQTYLLKERKSS